MSDQDRSSAAGGRDLKRQCRGLGMAGKHNILSSQCEGVAAWPVLFFNREIII